MDLLSDLNPQQREAVTSAAQQTLVLAGPGSGKTRVLTYRIAYLIQELGVRPYNILAVTFTNKAAREMEARLQKLLGESAEGMWLGTFHAMCARLLRREADRLPVKSNFIIMDADDQEALVKRSIKELNIDEKLYRPAGVHAAISSAKNNLQRADDYPTRTYRDEIVNRVYHRYEELMLNNNAFDFDDLLLWSVRLLQENPDLREKYSRRFHHVLVDEFQDTNVAQYQLLRLLCSQENNAILVVGDEDQSIYRWRGADYKNVLRFEEDYPKAAKVLLEQNYRSTQTVLDAARAVIDRNPYRTPKRLFSDRGKGEKITLYEAVDDHAEAAYVVESIALQVGKGKDQPGDFAVMYRTNAMSRLLEEAFLRAGLPYRLVGAQRFYGRREVKDLIAYLRLIQNPADELSLGRVINVPRRGIGDKTLVALQLVAQHNQVSAGDVLSELGKKGDDSPYWKALSGRGTPLLADFGALLGGWIQAASEIPLPALFDRILTEISYQQYIDDDTDEGKDRWENVQELRRLAYEYQDRGLVAFLETLALVSDQDTVAEAPNAPTMLTLHAAKGLEFGQVFIVGLDEGLLPHSRALDDPEEMAEERRLFYVGLTRARNRLTLVRAANRTNFGSNEPQTTSRFVADIPDELLQRQGIRSARWGSTSSADRRRERDSHWEAPQRWESTPTYRRPEDEPQMPAAKAAPAQKYHPSQRVRHGLWGEGMVLISRIQDGEEVIDVFFETVGNKRLIASLAKLDVVE